MDDLELIQSLLGRQESDGLDFKSQQYNLDNNYGRSKFIKDIVAMANTPRIGPAYIVLGVLEQSGKVVSITGVSAHPDESELGRIVSGRVTPMPRFSYRQIQYDGLELGIVEISSKQPGVITPRVDFHVLRPNAIYIRRNAQNVEADTNDLARIFGSPQSHASSVPNADPGSWDQLYRVCDGFDSRRVYIAVLERMAGLEGRDWDALSNVPWNIIVDFDARTDTAGNYAFAKEHFRERRALRLSALEDPPAITARSTIWVAASGLESRPTTNPSGNWREWNRAKVPQLERLFDDLARITEPAPVTLVVLGGEPTHALTTCEVVDRVFTDRVDYVVANPDSEQYGDVVDRFTAANISITPASICQGLRDIQRDSCPTTEVLVPRFEGGTVAIDPERATWINEQLEIVQWDILPTADDEVTENMFLKGSAVSWNDLISGIDVDRDIRTRVEHHIVTELNLRETRRLNFSHWPGAGATTVARRIAWNLHRQFPTVIASEIQPQETSERLQHLFGITRMPTVVIIDLPDVAKEVVDRFFDVLRSSHIPAVLFNVERRFDLRAGGGPPYLDAMLSTREAVGLSDVLGERVPERRVDLEGLVDSPDRRKRTPFYFGLTAYGRDFQGIEAYVEARLSSAAEPVRESVILMAFAYYYGQIPLSLQTFGRAFNLPASRLVTLSRVMPDYIRELLVEEHIGARPAHYVIAEEILEQGLAQAAGSRANWRIGLADLAIKLIDLLAELPHRSRGKVSDVLRAVLIERGRGQSPAGPWEANFSRFLEDVPSIEGRQRVLEHLTNTFQEEPHFWAHLGRFYSRAVGDHSRAHEAHQRAIQLLSDDSLVRHMAGMAWRADLYDLLSTLREGVSRDQEELLHRKLREATRYFEEARALDRRSEYNYISHVQMILRVVGNVSAAQGYRYEPIRFLTSPGNDFYRELVDQAQNLLSDLALIKGDETPSQLQTELQASLDGLFGNPSQAIQRLQNVLDQRESYKPPLRRAIIRNYVHRREGDWGSLRPRELDRVLQLAEENITEEPASDYNLRLWLRAVRTAESSTVERVAEQLANKRLQNPSVDTTFYLYIMKFLELESGDLVAKSQVSSLIEDCAREAQGLSRTSSSFEWLGNDTGLGGIVHVSTLGEWNPEEGFWSNPSQLKRVRGHIARFRNQGSGEIELPSGLRVFFAPSRGAVQGGYVSQDLGREVEFYLGFSYDGLRAWSVADPAERG